MNIGFTIHFPSTLLYALHINSAPFLLIVRWALVASDTNVTSVSESPPARICRDASGACFSASGPWICRISWLIQQRFPSMYTARPLRAVSCSSGSRPVQQRLCRPGVDDAVHWNPGLQGALGTVAQEIELAGCVRVGVDGEHATDVARQIEQSRGR